MNSSRDRDEKLLIDFLGGECSFAEQRRVSERLASDARFASICKDMQAVRDAAKLIEDEHLPAGLVENTINRIRISTHTERDSSVLNSSKRADDILANEASNRRRPRRQTFSMRELVVAIAAMVVLGIVFIPAIQRAGDLRDRNLCQSNLGRIGTGLQGFASDNAGMLPASGSCERWLPLGKMQVSSNSSGWFKLILSGHVSPQLFQCPSVGRYEFGDKDIRIGMSDFPSGKFIHYSYQHMLGGEEQGSQGRYIASFESGFPIGADDSPLFNDGKFQRSNLSASAGDNHDREGQNILLLRGNVIWSDDPNVGIDGNNIYQADDIYSYDGDETPANTKDSFLLPAHSTR